MRKIIFWILLIGTGIFSIMPHLLPGYWLGDIFSHFKLQYLLFLLLLLPAGLVLFRKKLVPLIPVLLLLLWNARFILPLYLEGPIQEEASGGGISILAINLLASNTNYAEALGLIAEKNPDVVILLEVSPQWEEQLEVLTVDFPFHHLLPQKNNFGIGILSKNPVKTEVSHFNRDFPPSLHSKLEIDGHLVSILATHPVPPVGQAAFELRNEQLQAIEELSATQAGNFIVVGDLNTSSYSTHFQNLLLKGELRDSRKGSGIAATWPADLPFMRTTLDHFLLKGSMKVLKRTTERDIGSDHLPIFIRLGF
ncbi:endonuclease/exonuclease/phosphatase family protein [Salinimicrobium sp. HB62]|uniref:endonuclease/exonuclease/phosphatase family protein n=1 Tax=Salinimicrobium sp. HB62 TaxID=3077781 RepID=UPI002D772EFA|nr:endonuclease/exonuclease/phosphatase family protein [Salinimicrobium sp. HB62]